MNANSPSDPDRAESNVRLVAICLVVAIAVALAVYLFWPKSEPIPEPGWPLETVEPAKTAEERGDTARDIIARLKDDPGGPDYAEAHTRAKALQADGQLADAQLLYFFAARGGHAPAAFDLATANDPNHFSTASSLAAEADPFQAYRWYTVARNGGHAGASERLEELRAWAESASRSGDADAEQLLLQWEQAP
jgi:hypothetical protein